MVDGTPVIKPVTKGCIGNGNKFLEFQIWVAQEIDDATAIQNEGLAAQFCVTTVQPRSMVRSVQGLKGTEDSLRSIIFSN